jgi:hypothetical protein
LVAAYLDELAAFPSGQYRDQADATGGAFNRLAPLAAGPPRVNLPPPEHRNEVNTIYKSAFK